MSNQFREIDRSQPITLPGNLEGWLDGRDLAHFIVEDVVAHRNDLATGSGGNLRVIAHPLFRKRPKG